VTHIQSWQKFTFPKQLQFFLSVFFREYLARILYKMVQFRAIKRCFLVVRFQKLLLFTWSKKHKGNFGVKQGNCRNETQSNEISWKLSNVFKWSGGTRNHSRNVTDCTISCCMIDEVCVYAVIAIAIRLRYDYDPTTAYRARLLPFDAFDASKKWTSIFRRSRIVVVS